MSRIFTVFIAVVLAGMLAGSAAVGAELKTVKKVAGESGTEFIIEFSDALYKRNHITMSNVVAKHRSDVAKEAEGFFETATAPGVSMHEQEAMFYLLERLATVYRDVTGKAVLLNTLKKKMFESRLSAPVASEKSDGLYVVKKAVEGQGPGLYPDNIVIRSGETVRWVNNDATAQRLASVMAQGRSKEILSPEIDPGGEWEHTFYLPGEYYYISFPNKVLYGKVVVKE